jgi:hypothetical protein
MRIKWVVVPFALAFGSLAAAADIPLKVAGIQSSGETGLNAGALEKGAGAVYILKLRVPYDKIEGYVTDYAVWFLPVDQYVCDTVKYPGKCESSGRKLTSLLRREYGDPYNLLFLYHYESTYKENYYCKYQKAFFQYHLKAKTKKFNDFFNDTKAAFGSAMTADEVLGYFPPQCAEDTYAAMNKAALQIARETLRRFDLEMAGRVTMDESSWNFDVNVCQAGLLNPRTDPDKGGISMADKANLTAICPKSLLERAVEEVKWPKPGEN